MDITFIDPSGLKLKSRESTLVLNPTGKQEATGVCVFDSTFAGDVKKVEGAELVVKGPGEYELRGIKITAIPAGKLLCFEVRTENILMLMSAAASLSKASEKTKEFDIVIIEASGPIDATSIAAMSPKIVILFGEQAKAAAKTLGKDDVAVVNKVQVKKEKLPAEMEIIVVG